ncbi:MAG: Ig-like domain repeat protein [Alphaproteobacteria bacterium]|nr:Ig-like domain repeat protein [Alphaproteobacteria bacterium]
MSIPTSATVTGGTSYPDVAGDNIISVDQTVDTGQVTITAANGDNDTILGGAGDMIVDASTGTVSLDVSPGFGATTILGGSGTLFVEEDSLGSGGLLDVRLGIGAATIHGSTGGTIVTPGMGNIEIIADGQLSIVGNDLSEKISWTPVVGDVINVTTNPVTQETTIVDTGTNVSVSLSGGQIVVDATAASGAIHDFANPLGSEVINLGSADVSVTASLGSDSINAGSGNVTVDAGGNANPITVNGGAGTLTFNAGAGNATITGGTTSTIINGGAGTIALTQHDVTMIRAGDGAITVTSDSSLLSVTGADGTSTTNWTAPIGDTVTITTDGTGATTLLDTATNARTVLAGGYATNYITAPPIGVVNDLPDHNVITLGPGDPGGIIVNASQGIDTINAAGSMWGVTVNATGNANPIVVTGAMMGPLTFNAGSGDATISGGIGTTVTGGAGSTVLNQNGASTIYAHGGTITVNADGNLLTVIGADGTSTNSWTFASGDVVTISSVGAITTISDPISSLVYTLPAAIPPTLTVDPFTHALNASGAAAGLTISGTTSAEDDQVVSVQIVDQDENPVGAPYSATVSGGMWSVTVPGSDHLADGNYTVIANVTDLAGTPAVPASQALSVDETAPTLTIDPFSQTLNATGAAAGLTIRGTTNAEDDQVVSVQIVDADENPVGNAYQATVAGGEWSLIVPGSDHLADGSYTITATVLDAAGNPATPASQTLMVDETAPAITLTDTGVLTNRATQTVGGTGEIGATVTVWDGAASVGSATVGLDSKWSASVTLTASEGLHTLTATATDAAGNVGSSNTTAYTLDTTAPLLTVNNLGGPTNQTSQTLTGTGEVGRTVVVTEGAAVLGTARVQLNGTWSTNVTLSSEGSHSLTVSETDAANNATARIITYTLDTTPPVAPVITSTGQLTNNTAVMVAGTAEAGGTVTVWDGATSVGSATVDGGGNWIAAVTLTSEDGTHSLTAKETDAAGNTGIASSAVDYTLDTTPPDAPVITSLGGLTNQASQTMSGTGEIGGTVIVWDGLTSVGSAMVDEHGNWSAAVTLTPGDGTHSLTAKETDAAGNTGNKSVAVDYDLDTTPPLVTIAGTVGLTNEVNQAVSGTAEALSTVTLWDGATTVGSATADEDGHWSTTVTLSGEGLHSLTASQTDAAGNTGTSSAISYTLDTTPPVLTVTNMGGPINQPAVTLSGTGEVGRTVVVTDSDATVLGTGIVGLDGTWSTQVTLTGEWPHSITVSETDAADNASSRIITYTLDTTPPDAPVITSTGQLTNDPAVTLAGTGEIGGTVVVWDGATSVGSATVGGDGNWSVAVTLTGDGAHSLTAKETDLAGNTGASSAAVVYDLDTTPPTVTITGTVGLTNQASQTVSGTAEALSTVTVWDGVTSVGSAAADEDGNWTTTVTLSGDGTHSLTAKETDLAGNTGTSSAISYTLDTTPPAVTIASSGGPVNQASQTVIGTAEAGRTVTVWDGETSVGSGTVGLDGHWSVHVTLTDGDGSHSLTATETDAAGNLGTSAPVIYTLDTVAPTLAIDPIGQVLNASGAMAGFAISGTTDAEDGQVVSLQLMDGGIPLGSYAATVSGGHWSASVSAGATTGLYDGNYTIVANVADQAGNPAMQASQSLTVDETAPTVAIDALAPVNAAMAAAGFAISGTTDAEDGQVVNVQLMDGGIPLGSYAATVSGGHWSASVSAEDAAGLVDGGFYTVTADVTDRAGNPAEQWAQQFAVDETPPAAPVITSTGVLTNDPALTVVGTGEAGGTVILWDGATSVGSATVDDDGHWSANVTLTTGDGAHSLTARETDAAGNTGAGSDPVLYTLDTTAPDLAVASAGGPVNQTAQRVHGTGEVGATVVVSEGDNTYDPVTVDGDGNWSVDITLSGEASHTLTVSETDTAGNVSTSTVSYTLDQTAPTVTIIGTGGLVNQASQTVSGTAEANGTVILWDGATSVGSATVGDDGNWSATVNLGTEGPHSLTASETDAAGNVGTSGRSVDYTLDMTPPMVTIASLGRVTNQPTQTVSGTAEANATIVVWDGSASVASAVAGGDGNWSAAVTLVGDGSHSLTATATDHAGNTSTSGSVAYTLDTTPVASGDGNPYAGAIGQQLANLLGSLGDLSYFGPNQPIPDASTGSPALLITGNAGAVTVPGGVSLVRNQAAGTDLQGSGQANQVVVSSTGFTFHSNGGSGIVLADDAQAGGPAGNSNIVLARSNGGDFVISTGSGDDTVDAASGNVSVAAGGGHNMIWLGSGNALVTSSGADTVVSGTGAATVHATAGSDALVFGGSNTLTFVGESGAATVVGGAGSTNLVAGSGRSVFWGSENGGNTMYAGTGAATLVGGGSGNVIHAAGSADLLIVAGTGNSTLVGGSATGNNVFWGSQGDDVISAGQGNDTIIGGPGHDTVQAGGGNALIFGGVDGSTFVAGSGTANIVSGNGGANTFAFINGQAGGTEIIWGFRAGTDHLSLQGYGADELANATAGAQGYGLGTQIGLSDGTKIIFGDIASLKGAALG